jgi:hypothetical protein
MIKILHNLALFWVKNANFFAEFFGENILKIITSVPGHTDVLQIDRDFADTVLEKRRRRFGGKDGAFRQKKSLRPSLWNGLG